MIHIISGGTISHIRPHLALCAPASGQTGRELYQKVINTAKQCQLHQTRMAGGYSIQTNQDVADLVTQLCSVSQTKAIIMCAALCDYEVLEMSGYNDVGDRDTLNVSKELPRLKTSCYQEVSMELVPAPKIINDIKHVRPDIVLVGFKTTTLATVEEQKEAADNLAFNSGADLVLSNDIFLRRQMVSTYAGDVLTTTDNRTAALQLLVDEVIIRCSR